jgi:hypothetical protein
MKWAIPQMRAPMRALNEQDQKQGQEGVEAVKKMMNITNKCKQVPICITNLFFIFSFFHFFARKKQSKQTVIVLYKKDGFTQ